MGMAASQARYLSLTARKTNVEYEGQQVNQERTALANQSAGLFNQMLALEVPTPPSASDYSKTYLLTIKQLKNIQLTVSTKIPHRMKTETINTLFLHTKIQQIFLQTDLQSFHKVRALTDIQLQKTLQTPVHIPFRLVIILQRLLLPQNNIQL